MSKHLEIDFWFEFASTYSYLSAGRIERLCAQKGVRANWKPFLLGPIFKEQGMEDSPFNLFPAKGKYMWKDLERRCKKYDLPFERPDKFPQNGLKAARIVVAFSGSEWIHEFTRRVYLAEFSRKKDIGETETLSEILKQLGQSSDNILEKSESQENKSALRENTETAKSLGIFGAPSFIVRGELFWGDDRLEDALEFLIRT